MKGQIDPVARAFLLEEALAHLNEARLNGEDVPPERFAELEGELEQALAAEPDARTEILPQLAELTAWLAAFCRGGG